MTNNHQDLFKSLTEGLQFNYHAKPTIKSNEKFILKDSEQENSEISEDSNQESSLKILKKKKKKRKRKESLDIISGKDLKRFKSKNELKKFRKALKISVKGHDDYEIPEPISEYTLSQLISCLGPEPITKSLKKNIKTLLNNIENSNFNEPTPVQMQSIPCFLKEDNLIVCSPTGSGKTAAFLLPIILKSLINPNNRSIILAPTIELAQQIQKEANKLSATLEIQFRLLTDKKDLRNCHIISTPKKLIKSFKIFKNLTFNTLAIDEADKLFDKNFLEQLSQIFERLTKPKLPQITLFSATFPSKVLELVKPFLIDPLTIQISGRNSIPNQIDQKLVFVGQENGKFYMLREYITTKKLIFPLLVFVECKKKSAWLYKKLRNLYKSLPLGYINSDIKLEKRTDIINRFSKGEISILICSDLIGRGIDFENVTAVLNYDCPRRNIEYIHRVGRTGRANRKGKAFTFFTIADFPVLRSIANVIRASGESNIDEWMNRIGKDDFSKSHKRYKKKTKK